MDMLFSLLNLSMPSPMRYSSWTPQTTRELSTPWVNLGTAGGRLSVSELHPKVEEGEIKIPSIGFSGQRRYYTAVAARQTFGGPVDTNPKLYLGDWDA